MRKPAALEILFVVAAALLASGAVISPPAAPLRGWSIDALTTLRSLAFGERRKPGDISTVVVALDEDTYRSEPFRNSPTVTWTGDIGRVVSAILAGGARVVGFDVVFATSIEDSRIPFGGATVGEKLRGFDRDFLRALASGAHDGRIVLGEILRAETPIVPTAGQRMAVGGSPNLRALNVIVDADNVVRRVPLVFPDGAAFAPSLSLELAARALGQSPEVLPGGGVALGGRRLPTLTPGAIAVGFSGDAGETPTYSLADLAACLGKGDLDFFRRAFSGKVVLLGTNAAGDDLILTAARFLGASPRFGERCALPEPPPPPPRRTMSGVYLQAAAVDNLIRGEALAETGPGATVAIAFAAAVAGGLAALTLGAVAAALSAAGLALGYAAAATAAFQAFETWPLVEPAVAGAATIGVAVAVRFAVVDREKRFLRRAFGLYLAPSVIDRIWASGELPALGGETREVTLMFCDLVGFSTLSERLPPAEVVALMNDYFSEMSEAIEKAGGFVDKFVGDAIVALFGAPMRSEGHAAQAVAAALECKRRLAGFNRGRASPIGHRIGLNTGEALVGNVGSRRRFNYTAFGDAVNLAARLEAANACLGTSILVSQAVRDSAGDAFVWREIATLRVRGRETPVTVFEPLARAGEATPAMWERAQAYAAALAAFRNRDFARAETGFARFPDDPAAASFRLRCRPLVASPPDATWTPVLAPPTK